MHLSLLAWLQAAAPAAPGASFLTGILPIVLMIAIFYFLVFMPMRRQQKNTREMIKSLQSGQTVQTSGGIIGTIVAVNDDTLILRIKPDNLKIQVARSAVTGVVPSDEGAKK
ncbi:MAG TPA: preprotein translocase subunit YajC [Bryobacteraceae bacterium]|jgi:preprotein translocase subunit YajC|nr:preprotein translocase subunit YajC [Bryobacteraceae bacterium]